MFHFSFIRVYEKDEIRTPNKKRNHLSKEAGNGKSKNAINTTRRPSINKNE